MRFARTIKEKDQARELRIKKKCKTMAKGKRKKNRADSHWKGFLVQTAGGWLFTLLAS
jgi:hypothetical protein